jgi:hypothetical protein
LMLAEGEGAGLGRGEVDWADLSGDLISRGGGGEVLTQVGVIAPGGCVGS